MQGKAAGRLLKEYQQLIDNPPSGVVVTSEAPSTLWDVHIAGPQTTPYEGGTFKVRFEFPETYPFKPPKAKFLTKVYHPSIKNDTGEICQDVYEKEWVPTKTVKTIVELLISMLISPNIDAPLEPEIAREFSTDRDTFDKKARDYTQQFAK